MDVSEGTRNGSSTVMVSHGNPTLQEGTYTDTHRALKCKIHGSLEHI
jgi:hypothetical protein